MRGAIAMLAAVLALVAGGVEAQEKVKVGTLKLTSSAVLFLGVEKGFFKEFGIEPELVFFRGFPFQDRTGRLWVQDIDKQMTWWQKHGFTKSVLPLKQIVDTTFLEAAARAVAE